VIEEGRLSRAIAAHQRNNFTGTEFNINPAKCSDWAVGRLQSIRGGNDFTG